MSLDRNLAIEVHVAGICLRRKSGKLKVLIVRRAPTKRLFPRLWECGGGQVEPGENFKEAIKRELEQELGVIAEPIMAFGGLRYQCSGTSSEEDSGG